MSSSSLPPQINNNIPDPVVVDSQGYNQNGDDKGHADLNKDDKGHTTDFNGRGHANLNSSVDSSSAKVNVDLDDKGHVSLNSIHGTSEDNSKANHINADYDSNANGVDEGPIDLNLSLGGLFDNADVNTNAHSNSNANNDGHANAHTHANVINQDLRLHLGGLFDNANDNTNADLNSNANGDDHANADCNADYITKANAEDLSIHSHADSSEDVRADSDADYTMSANAEYLPIESPYAAATTMTNGPMAAESSKKRKSTDADNSSVESTSAAANTTTTYRLKQKRVHNKNPIIPMLYPWATDRRAKVLNLAELEQKGITTIRGQVECVKCGVVYDMEYNMLYKFLETADFLVRNRDLLHHRADHEWFKSPCVPCRDCGYSGPIENGSGVKPVIGKKKTINWLFLLAGRMICHCKLKDLKYFCKHSGIHRTGAKDRLMYLTYLGLCKQLDPAGCYEP